MKRTLCEAYAREDQLKEFKQTIRDKSSIIIEKELEKLISRSLNQENVSKYLKSQYELDTTNGDVLKAILESVQHIPASQLFEDIKRLSSDLWGQLGSQHDKSFYIVLTGESVYKKKGTPCTEKSNIFLSILFLCYNVNLLDNFVDFICMTRPLHSDVLSQDITNYVYLDDASFSGTQISTSIMTMGATLQDQFPGKDFKMHLVVLYLSEYARSNMLQHNFPGDTQIYTTDTIPNTLHDSLLSLRDIDKAMKQSVAQAFTRDSPGVFDEMDKSLFYTDLKIPDSVSIYPRFLLSPVLVDSELGTSKFPYPLVNNCRLPIEGEEKNSTGDFYSIDNGTFCPIPTYKEKHWKERVADLFPMFRA